MNKFLMRYKMLNLTPHNRLHVPNRLAMLAAVLLLVISAFGFDSRSEISSSGADASHSAISESVNNDDIDNDVTSKRRGLNLGSLLFRRG
jgi:hypothetical protein